MSLYQPKTLAEVKRLLEADPRTEDDLDGRYAVCFHAGNCLVTRALETAKQNAAVSNIRVYPTWYATPEVIYTGPDGEEYREVLEPVLNRLALAFDAGTFVTGNSRRTKQECIRLVEEQMRREYVAGEMQA